jgi:acylphosphatase
MKISMESKADNGQNERLHVFVKGLVQGVGFRAFVHRTAASLNIKGWVRNCWDGSVEVLAEGENEDLQVLLSSLWKGPRSSQVEDISIEWQTALNEFSGFFVRPTG